MNEPTILIFIKHCSLNSSTQIDIVMEVKFICNMIGILQNLWLRRIFLGPFPLLLQFFTKRIGILHTFNVTASARITIPIPRATNAAPSLINPYSKPQTAQSMEHIKAAKTSSNDDSIKFTLRFGWSRFHNTLL